MMDGGWIGDSCSAHALIYDRTPTSFTAQFQSVNGGYLKCVRYYFSQQGEDIVAWGGDCTSTDDLSQYGRLCSNYRGDPPTTSKDDGAYGVFDVEVSQRRVEDYSALPEAWALDRELVEFVVPEGGATVAGAISGDGEVWVKGSAERLSGTREGFLPKEYETILENVSLHDVEVTGGDIGGGWIGSSHPATIQYVTRDDSHIYVQLVEARSLFKGVLVVLKQQGSAVVARIDWARFRENAPLDTDLSWQYDGTANIATSDDAEGYGIKNLTFTYRPCLALAGGKDWRWGNQPMVIDGAAVDVRGEKSPLPANSTTIIRNGGVLTLSTEGGEFYGEDSRTYVIEKDSRLRLNSWMALTTGGRVVLNGGTLEAVKWGDDYVNDLVVTNGGRLVGATLRVGFAVDANLRFEGPEPLTVECGFVGFKDEARETRANFIVNVDTEITGELTGDEKDWRGLIFVKQGPAQLTWHRNSSTGPVRVEQGTLRLAADDSFIAGRGQTVTLAGGTLVTAANVSSDALTLGGDAAIDVEAGTLAFADSSAAEWTAGARLTLTGDRFSRNSRRIRFGTNAHGLTGVQLRAIRFAGDEAATARLDDQGYLYAERGFVILYR